MAAELKYDLLGEIPIFKNSEAKTIAFQQQMFQSQLDTEIGYIMNSLDQLSSDLCIYPVIQQLVT